MENIKLQIKLNNLKEHLKTQKKAMKDAKENYLNALDIYNTHSQECSDLEHEICVIESILTEESLDIRTFKKYGLEKFIDKECSDTLVIPTNKFKEFEDTVDKMLSENKHLIMKLFNQQWVREPHYIIFNTEKH